MPSNYVGSAVDHTDITIPIGTDPRAASSVSTPLSELMDKIVYMQNTHQYSRFRVVTTSANLQAIDDAFVGEIVFLEDCGAYRYASGSHILSPFTYAATGMGTGIWKLTSYDQIYSPAMPVLRAYNVYNAVNPYVEGVAVPGTYDNIASGAGVKCPNDALTYKLVSKCFLRTGYVWDDDLLIRFYVENGSGTKLGETTGFGIDTLAAGYESQNMAFSVIDDVDYSDGLLTAKADIKTVGASVPATIEFIHFESKIIKMYTGV